MPKSTPPKRRRSPPKVSALEAAVRIIRKVYVATGGKPRRWESLDNLGAVQADAPPIAYAVERGWVVISGGFHSLTLTEDGRQRLKWRCGNTPAARSAHGYAKLLACGNRDI
jgi:hypothetical protein